MFELLNGLTKGRIGVLGHVEFDYGGPTVFHDVSHNIAKLLKYPEGGLPENVVCCGIVGSSLPTPFAPVTPLRKGPPPRNFGELADPAHFRQLTADALDVAVDQVGFAELQATESYREALHDAIRAELDDYNADSPTAVLSNHLGSSIRIID